MVSKKSLRITVRKVIMINSLIRNHKSESTAEIAPSDSTVLSTADETGPHSASKIELQTTSGNVSAVQTSSSLESDVVYLSPSKETPNGSSAGLKLSDTAHAALSCTNVDAQQVHAIEDRINLESTLSASKIEPQTTSGNVSAVQTSSSLESDVVYLSPSKETPSGSSTGLKLSDTAHAALSCTNVDAQQVHAIEVELGEA